MGSWGQIASSVEAVFEFGEVARKSVPYLPFERQLAEGFLASTIKPHLQKQWGNLRLTNPRVALSALSRSLPHSSAISPNCTAKSNM